MTSIGFCFFAFMFTNMTCSFKNLNNLEVSVSTGIDGKVLNLQELIPKQNYFMSDIIWNPVKISIWPRLSVFMSLFGGECE